MYVVGELVELGVPEIVARLLLSYVAVTPLGNPETSTLVTSDAS